MEGHNGFIAGGCFKNIFNGEKVKDIDMFFKDEKELNNARRLFTEKDYKETYETKNVVAFRETDRDGNPGIVIELVKKVFGTPEEIVSKFDFTITKFAYYKEKVDDDPTDEMPLGDSHIENHILCDDMFFEHLFMKRLVIDGELTKPVNSLERMIRYIKYGYMPCRETKLKLLNAIKDSDIDENELSASLYDGLD